MDFEQHVFVSDVHLGAFSEAINKKTEDDLITLIEHCKDQNYALYILGDLFDYWMEYPKSKFVPKSGERVLDAFENYNRSVKPALFITGNHDNWTFGHFENRGFEVEENARFLNLNERRFLLMHGDGVSDTDLDFPRAFFHRLLRNNHFVRLYQYILPPKTGLATMKRFSSITRKRNVHDPKPLNRQAEKLFNLHDLDFILTGHDHIPRMETFSGGTYLNTGAFFKHRSIAVFNNNTGLNLVTWHAETKKFIPFEITKEHL